MKKKLSILAVLVLAVAMSLSSVGGTYAKYAGKAGEATATAQIAKFEVTPDATVADTLVFTSNVEDDDDYVAEGMVAPGTEGSLNIAIKNKGDVSVKTSFAIDNNETVVPNGMKFYTTKTVDATTNEVTYSGEITRFDDVDDAEYSLSDTLVKYGETKNVVIYYVWDFDTTPVGGNDANDTSFGAVTSAVDAYCEGNDATTEDACTTAGGTWHAAVAAVGPVSEFKLGLVVMATQVTAEN